MITLGTLLVMALQDFLKKYITISMLIMAWSVSMLEFLWKQSQLFSSAGIKIGLGILISMLLIHFGKNHFIGKGDYLVLIWLFSFGSISQSVQVVAYGLTVLCMFAIGMKIKQAVNKDGKKEARVEKTEEEIKLSSEIPMIPFLWIGYLLMWIERGMG